MFYSNHTISYDIQSFPQPAVSRGISVGENFVSGFECGIPRVDGKTGM